MVPYVQREHQEELKEQVSEMEEYGGGHEKGATQGVGSRS